MLILLLTGLALGVLFFAGTRWLQAYIYSEAVEDLYWRAPAAAAAVTVFLGLLCLLASRHLGTFDPLSFSAKKETTYQQFWSVVKSKPKDREAIEEKTLFKARKISARPGATETEYLEASRQPPRPWKRTDSEGRLVDAIVVEEGTDKKEVRFNLKRPRDDKFGPGELAIYEEESGGRVMREDPIGYVSVQRGWLVVLYIVLNALHLAVWFVCLWLLLRFQWPHALGLAALLWLTMTLWLVPMIMRRVEQASAPTATQAMPAHPDARTLLSRTTRMSPIWGERAAWLPRPQHRFPHP